MKYNLKSYLADTYPNKTAEEIFLDLSAYARKPSNLETRELATFFATYPKAEDRLQAYIAQPISPEATARETAVYGSAKTALNLLSYGMGVKHSKVIEISDLLLAEGLITQVEYNTLQEFLFEPTTKAEKGVLGYLPTVEQIQSALDLAWPQQS